jgi:hypothetical protein
MKTDSLDSMRLAPRKLSLAIFAHGLKLDVFMGLMSFYEAVSVLCRTYGITRDHAFLLIQPLAG